MFLITDRKSVDELLAKRAENTRKISELLAELERRCETPDERRLLDSVKESRQLYVGTYLRALHLLVDENNPEAARVVMVEQATPALFKYHGAWDEFVQFQMDQLDRGAKRSMGNYAAIHGLSLSLITIAVIITVTVASFATYRTAREMNSRIHEREQARTMYAEEFAARTNAEERVHLQAAALEAAANAVVITDPQGSILWTNRAFSELTGYSAEEARGRNPHLLKSGHHDRAFYDNLWRTITAGEIWRGEIINRRKNGMLYTEETTITPVRADGGAVTHFVAIKQDITLRKAVETALQRAEEKYRAIFEDAIVGIFQATPQGRLISANRALANMYGYDSPEQLMAEVTDVGQTLFVRPGQRQEIASLLEERGTLQSVEVEVLCKDGSRKWLLANVRAVRDKENHVILHEGTVQDITERKAAEKEALFLAYYDALTGLPNRTLFQDRLAKALAGARRHGEKVALLFLDIDRFKTINDSLGHSAGDLLLKAVAERLKHFAREQDTVSRLGGDEFVLIINGLRDVTDVAIAADRVMAAVAQEVALPDNPLTVSCSIGISIFPDHGSDAETLLKNADAAMYCAKENGRSNFQFFTHEMNVRAVERLTLQSSLRTALDRNELFPVYQPQVDLRTGRISGAEVLLRWQHPKLGLVPPAQFIPIAENNGQIIGIGEWVLRTACTQARQWQDEGFLPIPVAVNVSAVQFRQSNFVDLIRSVLHDTGLAPEYLELEVTESLLLSDAQAVLAKLWMLRNMGLRLSIDDFGTGYSNLSYLQRFPVYKLKIDRCFVQTVTADREHAAITDTIIKLAKTLNLRVIAEGVENEEQLRFLRSHGCDEVQGYYFARPLLARDFARFCAEWKAAHSAGLGPSRPLLQPARA